MSYPGSPIETPDAWIERNPYDEQHEQDEGVYDQFPNQSLDTDQPKPILKALLDDSESFADLTLDQTESMSAWLDQQGDSLADPTSFDEWLRQSEDSLE